MPPIPSVVVDILKLGLIGLSFLLALLSYRLVKQSLDKPDQKHHGLISTYMVLTIALVGLTGVSILIEKLFAKPRPYPGVGSIAGEWEYVCSMTNAPEDVEKKYGKGYQHGGICTISPRDESDGTEWLLAGNRQWRSWDDKGGKPGKEDVKFPWKTEWGAITSKDAISYTYAIQTDQGPVKGFAWGNIRTSGDMQFIEGNFYQLPPVDTMSGTYVFKRKLPAK